jgi:TetR/AcrR family transcriptional regulator, transcriptional repressor for nem operon
MTSGGKRERLVAAACQTVYQQGIEKTTLADIAAAAGIPVGNVYYYFKTKNDIIQAVVEAHLDEADTLLAAIESGHDSPRDRLKALFAALAGQVDLIARYGCPHGSLCAELGKRGDGPGMAAELMRAPVEWISRQFAAMGRQDASDLAVHLLARYQGAALLTSTFRDPDLMAREAALAAQWIDALDLSERKRLTRFGLISSVAPQRAFGSSTVCAKMSRSDGRCSCFGEGRGSSGRHWLPRRA